VLSGPAGRRAKVVSRRGTTGRPRTFNPLGGFFARSYPWRGGAPHPPAGGPGPGGPPPGRWGGGPPPRRGGTPPGGAPGGRGRAGGGDAGQGGTGRAGAGLTGAASDDAVLTELYRQYRGPLLLFVVRLTAGDRQQAEDIVQETMVRAWREARRLDLSEPS